MLEERLSYLMLLHVNKDRTDLVSLKAAVNEFVGDSIHSSGFLWYLFYPLSYNLGTT